MGSKKYRNKIKTELVTQANAVPVKQNIKTPSSYIFKQTLSRIKQSVVSWRMALHEAEQEWYPQRVKLQQLYQDTVLNAHIEACMNKRKGLTLLKDFGFFSPDGKEDENLTKLFRKSWFKNYMNYAMDARAYGYSLISLGDIVDDTFPKLNVIPRYNVSPERLTIQHFMYSITGVPFTDPSVKDDYGNRVMDWVSWVPTPSETGVSSCGYGYLYKIGLLEIFLRNLLGQNGDFVQLFSQPYRVGMTSKTEENEREELAQTLEDMGSSGWAILDPTDEIKFLETKLGGSGYEGYDNFEGRLEAKISKVILRHASAMDSTPGKLGNPEDVKEALEEVQKEDNRFFEDHMNEVGIEKFRVLGFNIPVGYEFKFKNDHEEFEHNKKENEVNLEVATIAKTMKEAGMKMDPKYFTERTGIDFEEIKEPAPVKPGFTPKQIDKLKNLYE